MRRPRLSVMATVVMIFFFAANSQAGLTRIVPNVMTTNYSDPAQKQMSVSLTVYDDNNYRGPDFVKSITVNAPDGSVFSLHPVKDWLPYDRVYSKNFYATDFKGGKIPGGTYKVTVVPLVGSTIDDVDVVTTPPSFLPIPVVTAPASGATGIGSTLTIAWKLVAGATYYRVQVWNNTWNEPVYWSWDKQALTNLTRFKIPLGELQPNCQYKFRVEARSSSQDLDMRSRSDWFTFSTGSW
jgi:hypothetical protein